MPTRKGKETLQSRQRNFANRLFSLSSPAFSASVPPSAKRGTASAAAISEHRAPAGALPGARPRMSPASLPRRHTSRCASPSSPSFSCSPSTPGVAAQDFAGDWSGTLVDAERLARVRPPPDARGRRVCRHGRQPRPGHHGPAWVRRGLWRRDHRPIPRRRRHVRRSAGRRHARGHVLPGRRRVPADAPARRLWRGGRRAADRRARGEPRGARRRLGRASSRARCPSSSISPQAPRRTPSRLRSTARRKRPSASRPLAPGCKAAASSSPCRS